MARMSHEEGSSWLLTLDEDGFMKLKFLKLFTVGLLLSGMAACGTQEAALDETSGMGQNKPLDVFAESEGGHGIISQFNVAWHNSNTLRVYGRLSQSGSLYYQINGGSQVSVPVNGSGQWQYYVSITPALWDYMYLETKVDNPASLVTLVMNDGEYTVE